MHDQVDTMRVAGEAETCGVDMIMHFPGASFGEEPLPGDLDLSVPDAGIGRRHAPSHRA
jgi:hypothetical protein